MTEQIKTCVQITRVCKRGHLKTEATTFARVVTVRGQKYRVRECRACHALRNHPPGGGKTGRVNSSRWLDDKRTATPPKQKGLTQQMRHELKLRLAKEVGSRRLYEAIEAYRCRHERGLA